MAFRGEGMQTYKVSERSTSMLLLATSMGLVGTSMTANAYIVNRMPIMLAMFCRFTLATLLLLGLVNLIEDGFSRLPLRSHLYLAAQAFFGVWVFNVMLLIGLDMTTATMSGIMTATTPAVIAIFSWALGDRLPPAAWIGVLLTIGGVVIVNLLEQSNEASGSRPLLGGLCVFVAVIGEALYTIFGREVARTVPPLTSTAWICIYGMTFFLPFAVRDAFTTSLTEIPRSAWLAVGWLAVFVTVVAIALWLKGLQTLPASVAGAFTGMIPITAVLSAWAILGEKITWSHVMGILVVLIGIGMVATARGRSVDEAGGIP